MAESPSDLQNPMTHPAPPPPKDDGMTPLERLELARRVKMLDVYRTVAEVMPLEGRDYEVKMEWESETSTKIVFKIYGLNPLGVAFASAVIDYIKTNGLVE